MASSSCLNYHHQSEALSFEFKVSGLKFRVSSLKFVGTINETTNPKVETLNQKPIT
jgi:hypothetical protein